MVYLEEIISYLVHGPESDEFIRQSSLILPAMDSLESSVFPDVVANQPTATFLPDRAEDALSAYLLTGNEVGVSRQFYEAAMMQTKESVLQGLSNLDRKKVRAAILTGAGYDLAKLIEARHAFRPELDIAREYPSYFIPVRDFCGPPREEPQQPARAKRNIRGIDDFNEYGS